MKKVKEFVAKHKTGLTIAAGVGLVGASYMIGRVDGYHHTCSKYFVMDECKIAAILEHADNTIDGVKLIHGGLVHDGWTAGDLGKFGEKILEGGTSAEQKFTHFIAIGKKMD